MVKNCQFGEQCDFSHDSEVGTHKTSGQNPPKNNTNNFQFILESQKPMEQPDQLKEMKEMIQTMMTEILQLKKQMGN